MYFRMILFMFSMLVNFDVPAVVEYVANVEQVSARLSPNFFILIPN